MRRVEIAIIVALIAMITSAISFLVYRSTPGPLDHLATQQATIAGTSLKLYLPISSEAQAKGLGGIEQLPSNQGMLFYMPNTDHPSIWMKDMLISIDAIWLDKERRVVHIEQNISPDSYPKIFRNPVEKPAQYVLEIASGEVGHLGINLDDELTFDGKVHKFLQN